ncbi:unnamed protein product [Sympodiomycopsis kandeliae]
MTEATLSNGYLSQGHRVSTKALVCKELHGGYHLEDIEVSWNDSQLQSQAVVEWLATGVCQTDLHITEGVIPATFPFIGGHEGSARILHLPKAYSGPLKVGDLVLATFKACTSCPNCQDSKPSQCYGLFPGNFVIPPIKDLTHPLIANGVQYKLKSTGESINGDFFGQSCFTGIGAVDLNCLVTIPSSKNLPLHELCAFGCGIQTGIGTVLNNLCNPIQRTFDHLPKWSEISKDLPQRTALDRKSKQSIVIFGIGTVGCAAIIGARLAKIETVIAVDVVDSKLKFAKEKCGATHTVNSNDFKDDPKALIDHIRSLCPYQQGVNMSFEASGFPGVADVAIRSLCIGGKAAIVGAGPDGVQLDTRHHEFLQNGWSVQGVFEGSSLPAVFLPYLLHLYSKGGQEWSVLKDLVTVYKPEQFEDIVKDIKTGKTIKAVIQWQ